MPRGILTGTALGIARDRRGGGQEDAKTRLWLTRDMAESEAAKSLPLRHRQTLGSNEEDGSCVSHEESKRSNGNGK